MTAICVHTKVIVHFTSSVPSQNLSLSLSVPVPLSAPFIVHVVSYFILIAHLNPLTRPIKPSIGQLSSLHFFSLSYHKLERPAHGHLVIPLVSIPSYPLFRRSHHHCYVSSRSSFSVPILNHSNHHQIAIEELVKSLPLLGTTTINTTSVDGYWI